MDGEKVLNGLGLLACLVPILIGIGFGLSIWLDHRKLSSAFAKAGHELDHILTLVEDVGTEPSTEAFVSPTGETTPNRETLVFLPQNLADFPWGGRCIELIIDAEDRPSLAFVESDYRGIVVNGKVCRAVGIPRTKTKNGRDKTIGTMEGIISRSPQLAAKLREIFPGDPKAILGKLLLGGAGIGGTPDWYQTPTFPKCPQCKKKMALIFQMESGSAMVYLFGCPTHPDSTATFYQLD